MSLTNVRLIAGGSAATTMSAVDKFMDRILKRSMHSEQLSLLNTSKTDFPISDGAGAFQLKIGKLAIVGVTNEK